ncbi:MAG: diacylglycerol kinase family protein [bacterium]
MAIHSKQKPFAILVRNPVSGQGNPEEIEQIIAEVFSKKGWSYTTLQTGKESDIGKAFQSLLEKATLVVAIGGDGTVAEAAQFILNSSVPLAIVPTGSANILAQELHIPLDVRQSVELALSCPSVRKIDAMRTETGVFLLQIGIGLDARMIRDTPRSEKRIWGRFAYLKTLLLKLFTHHATRYTIAVDGRNFRIKALQVLVANAGVLGMPPFTWGDQINPSDGILDLCIVKTPSLQDYAFRLLKWLRGTYKEGPIIRYERITRKVTIASDKPLSIQADGEIIGKTPITVEVVPQAITVVVPLPVE